MILALLATVMLTGGRLTMDSSAPATFDYTSTVALQGEDFSLPFAAISFDGWKVGGPVRPWLPIDFGLYPLGSRLDFNGFVDFFFAPFTYKGTTYDADSVARIDILGPAILFDAETISGPFEFGMLLYGKSQSGETVEFDLAGSGLVHAHLSEVTGGYYGLDSLSYEIQSVPEPGTALLLTPFLFWTHWMRKYRPKYRRQMLRALKRWGEL